ncbi:hypothetical protein KY321_04015 [Candidatus Woesearchaeota archaeon]|nr:hypothetical protein [Candidatus Woesearchaeota archaeon]
MKDKYTYRGIYDKGELGRINDVLSTQRELFLKEEEKQDTTKDKVSKYFLVLVGLGTIILITKVVSKWKK